MCSDCLQIRVTNWAALAAKFMAQFDNGGKVDSPQVELPDHVPMVDSWLSQSKIVMILLSKCLADHSEPDITIYICDQWEVDRSCARQQRLYFRASLSCTAAIHFSSIAYINS